MLLRDQLTENVLEVGQVRRADDGCTDAGLSHNPRERDLRHAGALLLRQLLNAAKYTIRYDTLFQA